MILNAETCRDTELLARFTANGDSAAFAELVRRHGPLARGVCERVCDRAEADDAYQAVLIVLARKAGSLSDPGRLGPWIYGVAVRCAMRARRSTRLRRWRESPMTEMAARSVDADWADVRPMIDAEIGALPEKLRAAIVLCELQGVGRAEAAMQLGVPEGTLSSRLARAKDALRVRLVRRGVALSAAGVGVMLGQAKVSSASVPAVGTPSAAAMALAELEVVMFSHLGIVKVILGLLTALGLTLAGIGLMPADKAKPNDVAAEKAKLQGTWRVESVTLNGKQLDRTLRDNSLGYVDWVFDGDLVKRGTLTRTYEVDPIKTPKRLDMRVQADKLDYWISGIYQLEGDTMTYCVSGKKAGEGLNPTVGNDKIRRTARPGSFDDSNCVVGILKRVQDNIVAEKAKLQGRWIDPKLDVTTTFSSMGATTLPRLKT